LEVALEVQAAPRREDLASAIGARYLVEHADPLAAEIGEALRGGIVPDDEMDVHVEERREHDEIQALVTDVGGGDDREHSGIDLAQQHGLFARGRIEDLDVEL